MCFYVSISVSVGLSDFVYVSVHLCVCVSRSEVSSWSSGTGATSVAWSLPYVSVSLSECLSVCVCLCVFLSVCLGVRYPAGVRALVQPAWPGHCPMLVSPPSECLHTQHFSSCSSCLAFSFSRQFTQCVTIDEL